MQKLKTILISKQGRIPAISEYEAYPLETLEELIEKNPKELGFDFETTGLNVRELDPVMLGICDGETSYIIDFTNGSYTKEQVRPYLLRLKNALWVAHNAKFDIGVLKTQFDIPIHEYKYWCTMVTSQVRYNGAEISHSYADCVERHFGIVLSKAIRIEFIDRDLDKPLEDSEINYLVDDIQYLLPLKNRQVELLQTHNMLALMEEIENPFLQPLVEMELEGVRLDVRKWQENAAKYDQEKFAIRDKLRQILVGIQERVNLYPALQTKASQRKSGGTLDLFAPEETYSSKAIIEKINPNSSTQIKKILKLLNVELESTDQKLLETKLLELDEVKFKDAREILTALLDLRKKEKLVSTYGINFLAHVDIKDLKVRTEYTQAFTDTGRLSSRNPNLQNIPRTTEMRSCFIPDSTDYVFVTIDFSQQELRIAAAYSEDDLLIANFKQGLDLHSHLAQKSFQMILGDPEYVVSKKVNEDKRDAHKPVLFGYIYGATGARMGQILNISRETGNKIIGILRKEMPKLTRYQDGIKAMAVEKGRVYDGTKYNRLKQFRVWRVNKLGDHQIEKQGANFPIQGTAATMTKEAIIKIYHYIKDNAIDGCIKMQVHDELVIQLNKNLLDHAPKFKAIMEQVGTSYLRGVLEMESSMTIAECWQK